MDSFEELNLAPELVEALAAEGIERPTALQSAAIPVVQRGHNLVAAAAPGAGVLVAVGAPLLGRLEAVEGRPVGLILTPTADRARALAEALGRIAMATGHRVAALGAPWALPERASILIATPADLLAGLAESTLTLEGVEALVVDGAAILEQLGALADLEAVAEALPSESQRVIVSLPITPAVRDFADRHARRSVTVPPQDAEGAGDAVPARGTVAVRVVSGEKEEEAAALAHDLLTDDVRHLVVFVRSEDVAADLGDRLALRGFGVGPAGTEDAPVWLVVDDLEGRQALDALDDDTGAAVSYDAPADPDALDRRHGGGHGGTILAEPREAAHLRDVAARTGYRLDFQATRTGPRPTGGGLQALLARVESALATHDVDAYEIVLEPLFQRHGPAAVAAAALALLRASTPERSSAPAERASAAVPEGSAPYARLFVSLGSKDGVKPGDLVGAITGEAGIQGEEIGRIDIRETFSRVDVMRGVADKVIAALNGTTVRGRAVRVDLDRSERGGGRGSGDRPGGRPQGGRGGPPRGRSGPSGGRRRD
ncbi:DbpA RNA binding domain-containing protein [Gaopeijia maritima]|uniref:DbpA RNA binding domain-containing protein n=1 Tax=Gaopeijia maritima TaxID=3119007 RepID=UPI00324DA5E0